MAFHASVTANGSRKASSIRATVDSDKPQHFVVLLWEKLPCLTGREAVGERTEELLTRW